MVGEGSELADNGGLKEVITRTRLFKKWEYCGVFFRVDFFFVRRWVGCMVFFSACYCVFPAWLLGFCVAIYPVEFGWDWKEG